MVGFYRLKLKGCATKHYHPIAGRALPTIELGMIAEIGRMGQQRIPILNQIVRMLAGQTDHKSLREAVITTLLSSQGQDEVSVADAELGAAEMLTIQVTGAVLPATPTDVGYGTLAVIAADTRRPPEGNPDLNLSLLGYQPNGAAVAYKDYGTVDDSLAPQFRGLFADHRQPTPGKYEVAVIGVAVLPGESLLAQGSGRPNGNGYLALVLYADNNQITLKYTPEDSVARGYTIFIEGVNVNPQLLAVYLSTNGSGRSSLPALRTGQLIGTATGGEIRLAIRDNAVFMDPHSQQDWWWK